MLLRMKRDLGVLTVLDLLKIGPVLALVLEAGSLSVGSSLPTLFCLTVRHVGYAVV